MRGFAKGGFWLIVALEGSEDETKSGPQGSAEKHVNDIRRATRKQYSTEEKIRIVLEGLRGVYSIAELCRREGIAQSLYYSWSKESLEAGKRRLAGDIYFGRGQTILLKRERIKRKTIEHRRLQHAKTAT